MLMKRVELISVCGFTNCVQMSSPVSPASPFKTFLKQRQEQDQTPLGAACVANSVDPDQTAPLGAV